MVTRWLASEPVPGACGLTTPTASARQERTRPRVGNEWQVRKLRGLAGPGDKSLPAQIGSLSYIRQMAESYGLQRSWCEQRVVRLRSGGASRLRRE